MEGAADWDVVVVGLGIAGSHLAGLCARSGLRVLGIDARPLSQAGPQWVNAVPEWMLHEAQATDAAETAVHARNVPMHFMPASGRHAVVSRNHRVLELDMGTMGHYLREAAEAAGAVLSTPSRVIAINGNCVQLADRRVAGRYVVDATGIRGSGLDWRSANPRQDVCSAAYAQFALASPDQAEDYVRSLGAEIGDNLSFTGRYGGYSVVTIRVTSESASVLTGSVPAAGFPTGRRIVAETVRELPWLGELVQLWSGAIPLGPPAGRVVRGNLAALGDSAGHVYTAHGSGIGMGLVASRALADAIQRGNLGSYQRWHTRRQVPMLAVVDTLRRITGSLSVEQNERMFSSGMVDASVVTAVLEQRLPAFGKQALDRLQRVARRDPQLLVELFARGAREVAASRVALTVA